MKEEVLTIDIIVTGMNEVKGTTGEACMILFEGNVDCKNFKGKVLPGGVDTQKQWYGESRSLSARYIIQGEDFTGEACSIFIENNGAFEMDGSIVTHPRILTNSKALAYLETADLTGTVTGTPKGVMIHIYISK